MELGILRQSVNELEDLHRGPVRWTYLGALHLPDDEKVKYEVREVRQVLVGSINEGHAPNEIPAERPKDKTIRHQIDLVPVTKYFATRCHCRESMLTRSTTSLKIIATQEVRKLKSPHISQTFCVMQGTGTSADMEAFNTMSMSTSTAL
ncbi:Reverse transcriptase [Phytophthora palmivora]|uniref:Reverse transcriptase n=1 Tax=Phytophthora palmivora TaxID=4796 RepID=A0A2P4XFS8_9STRA|nr:Reverse transcriptase [Phytophthora palmivora]